jgi:hypothetical protein
VRKADNTVAEPSPKELVDGNAQGLALDVPQRKVHRQLAAGEPRFADAVDAFVGVNDHEYVVPLPAPYRVGLDTGYLHVSPTYDGTRAVCLEQPATRSCESNGW